MSKVRGTVQADILKEDQAQNTCIYSIDFSLKLMGDVREYFIDRGIRNFYSVSISGYHIAEAGANAIPSWLSHWPTASPTWNITRGMDIEIRADLSFFFRTDGAGIFRDRPGSQDNLGEGDEVQI